MATVVCVLHGVVAETELGFNKDCGQIHVSPTVAAHTLNGDPCFPVDIPGIEGVIAPNRTGVVLDHRQAYPAGVADDSVPKEGRR